MQTNSDIDVEERVWYLEYRGTRIGPLRLKDIVSGVQKGALSSKAKLSRDQIDWVRIRDSAVFSQAAMKILYVKLDSDHDWQRMLPADFAQDEVTLTQFKAFADYEKMLAGIKNQLDQARLDRQRIKPVKKDHLIRTASIFSYFPNQDEDSNTSTSPKIVGSSWSSLLEALSSLTIPMWLKWALSAVAVIILTFSVLEWREAQRLAQFKQLSEQAHTLANEGEWKRANSALDRALALNPSDSKLKLEMSKNLVRQQRSEEAQVLLKEVIQEERDSKEVSEALSLSGLISLDAGDVGFAEAQFHKANSLMPESGVTLHNLGVFQLASKKYEEAEGYFVRAIIAGSRDIATAAGLADLALTMPAGDRRAKTLRNADKLLAEAMNTSKAYARQGLIYRARIAQTLGHSGAVESLLEALLNTDPDLDRQVDLEITVSRWGLSWTRMSEHCASLGSALQRSSFNMAVLGLCQAWAGNPPIAVALLQPLNREIASVSGPARVAQSLAHLTLGLGTLESEFAGVDQKTNRFLLPQLLFARDCEKKKDRDCAKEAWFRAYGLGSDSPAAIVAMSRIYLRSQDKEMAKALAIKVRKQEPGYFPGRQLVNELLIQGVAL